VAALVLQPVVVSEVDSRENNEDALFASPRLAAVAGGVGGATPGEVASMLAIREMIGLDERRLGQLLQQELSAAVADASAVIEFVISCDPQLAGIGTTLTLIALSRGHEPMA
jgi:serine/threonine protein phosphatase PrpC